MTIARIEDVAALAQAFGGDIKALDTDVDAIAPNVRKLNTEAPRAPLPTDDETQGYEPGSRWVFNGVEWLRTETGWVPVSGALTLAHFGAVGGGADDTDAIEAALRSGQEIQIRGAYRATRRITVSGPCRLHGETRSRDKITWTGANAGILVTPQTWQDPVEFMNVSLLTDATGAGVGVEVDQLGLPTTGIPFFDTRVRVENCRIAGATLYTQGWLKGVRLTFPFSARVAGNEFYGKALTGALVDADFVSGSVGVEIADQSVRTLAGFYLEKNVIMCFRDGAKIYNVEGIFCEGNDFQVCFDGLSIINTIAKVNQPRIRFNHFGVSNRQLIVQDVRQMILVGNEFSYRWGRTDGANVPLIHLIRVYAVSGTGNNVRGNLSNNTDMVLDGIWLESDIGSDPTTHIDITGGVFDRLNLVAKAIGPVQAVRNVNLMPNVLISIYSDAVFDWGNQTATAAAPLYLGSGNLTGIPKTNNVPLTIASNAAAAARLSRSTDGTVLQFLHGSTSVGSVNITATGSSMSTTSDARLKDSLGSMPEAGEIIDALQLHRFRWKATGSEADGVFAQELAEVYPDAVHHDPESDLWMVDYSALVPLILRELQSLRAKLK